MANFLEFKSIFKSSRSRFDPKLITINVETDIEHFIGTKDNKQSSHLDGQSPKKYSPAPDLNDRLVKEEPIDSDDSSNHQLMCDLDLIVKEEPIEINDVNEPVNDNKIGDISKAIQLDDGSWECEICSKVVKYKNSLVRHYRSHSSEKLFECSICHLKLTQSQNLVAHMRIHSGEKPFQCQVDGCLRWFRQRSNLNCHMRKHSEIKPFECSFCEKAFFTISELKTHERIHTGIRPYSCIISGCLQTFRERRQMIAHAGKEHDYKQYQCEWCKKRFAIKCNLKSHYRLHTGIKPFPCKLCSAEFIRRTKLRLHMQVVHGEEFE